MLVSNRFVFFYSILFASSCVYMAKFGSFSPVYLFQIIFSVLMIYLLFRGKVAFYNESILFCVLLIAYTIVNLIGSAYKLSTAINLICGLLSYMLIVASTEFFCMEKFISATKFSIKFILFVLSIDSFWRLTHPSAPTDEAYAIMMDSDNAFYLYKFGSILFADSNTVALICLSICFLIFFIEKAMNVRWLFLSSLSVFLLVGCLSRSAIISFLISFFLFCNISRKIKILISSMIIPLVIYFSVDFFSQDQSLVSKFEIINNLLIFYENSDLPTILFGVGMDGSPNFLGGIYSHIHFVTLLVEFGLIGFLLYLLFMLSVITSTNGNALYILVPIFISGFSYFFYMGAPFFFIPLAVISVINKRI